MNLRYAIRRTTIVRILKLLCEQFLFDQRPQRAFASIVEIWWRREVGGILGDEYELITDSATNGVVVDAIVEGVRILDAGPNRTPQPFVFGDDINYRINVEVVIDIGRPP